MRFAVSMFSAAIGLTTVVTGNTTPHGPKTTMAQSRFSEEAPNSGLGTFQGIIYAPDGTAVRFATVYVTHVATRTVNRATTDWTGTYKLSSLAAGTYTLRVEAEKYAPAYVPDLVLRSGDVNRLDQTLSIAVPRPENEEEVAGPGAGNSRSFAPVDPLIKAAKEDDLEAVKELLKTNNANRRDSVSNLTALECAVQNSNREMVQVLVWSKANVKTKNKQGRTLLMMLETDATSDLVWDLVNAGGNVNDTDNEGETALIESAKMNNTEVMKALLDAGAKVNVANNDGQTALIVAANEGLVNGVHMLIQAGAEINHRDKAGKSALAYARASDNRAVIRLLVSCNAVDFEQTSPR